MAENVDIKIWSESRQSIINESMNQRKTTRLTCRQASGALVLDPDHDQSESWTGCVCVCVCVCEAMTHNVFLHWRLLSVEDAFHLPAPRWKLLPFPTVSNVAKIHTKCLVVALDRWQMSWVHSFWNVLVFVTSHNHSIVPVWTDFCQCVPCFKGSPGAKTETCTKLSEWASSHMTLRETLCGAQSVCVCVWVCVCVCVSVKVRDWEMKKYMIHPQKASHAAWRTEYNWRATFLACPLLTFYFPWFKFFFNHVPQS